MKICAVCQRCYEDAAASCLQDNHGNLVASRAGSRLVAAKYCLDVLLERGVSGEVYQATDVNLNKPFVFRLFNSRLMGDSEQLRQRLNDELQTVVNINHLNVARTFDYGMLGNNEFYVVTELVGGQTLTSYLENSGALSEATAVTIARQIADGLEAIHSAGVIHRSINTASLVIEHDAHNYPLVKIQNFDFGGIKQQFITANISTAKPYLDVLRYYSPEQCARQAVDARTDIYSLGVVFYETLSGLSPFDAETPTAVVYKQIHEQPLLLNHLRFDVKALLSHTLMRSLNKNPASRPQTATSFVRHLRHLEYITKHSSAPSQKTSVNLAADNKSLSAAKKSSDELANFAEVTPAERDYLLSGLATKTANPTNLSDLPAAPTEDQEPVTTIYSSSDFDSEPIRVQKKGVAVAPFVAQAISVKRKDAGASLSTSQPVAFKTKSADDVLSTSNPVISPSGANVAEMLVQPAPLNSNNLQDSAGRAPKKALATKRFLLSVGLVAVLASFVVLGAMFVNQQTRAEQSAPSAASSPVVLNSEELAAAPNDASDGAANTAASLEEEGILAVTTEKQPVVIQDPDNRSQPREQVVADNTMPKPNVTVKEQSAPDKSPQVAVAKTERSQPPPQPAKDVDSQAELNNSLNKWVNATNASDVDQQMNYYAPKVNAYYLSRNASQEAIRAEKKRIFANAAVDIQASKPEIAMSKDGQSAKMRFRKKYSIKNGQRNRSGEVLQELHWVKSKTGWKIVSERDLKVINN